jgi:hypothetical protein
MSSTAFMLWTVLFSSVGMGYFVYGKKQGKASALLGGVALMVYPYMVSSVLPLVLLGAAFAAVPFFLEF